jgi:hypothetical protein
VNLAALFNLNALQQLINLTITQLLAQVCEYYYKKYAECSNEKKVC